MKKFEYNECSECSESQNSTEIDSKSTNLNKNFTTNMMNNQFYPILNQNLLMRNMNMFNMENMNSMQEGNNMMLRNNNINMFNNSMNYCDFEQMMMQFMQMKIMNQLNSNFDNKKTNVYHKSVVEKYRNEKDYLNGELLYYFSKFDKNYEEYIKNKRGRNKIIVNYYGLIKREVNVDLNLTIEELEKCILDFVFGGELGKSIARRTCNNQTTQFLINNLLYTIEDCSPLNKYFYVDFGKKDELNDKNKNGYDFGLKNDSEVNLKINDKLFNKIFNESNNDKKIVKLNFEFYPPIGHVEYSFIARPNDFISDVIEWYKYLRPGEYKFLLNGNRIGKHNQNQRLKELTNFTNNKIDVESEGITGGTSIMQFADVSKNKIKSLKFSKDAPSWRKVSVGLNIFGICQYPECEANEKEVVYIVYKNNGELPKEGISFNLGEESEKIICPICQKIIEPKTCGLWKCEYQFIGKKFEKGELIEYDSKPKETKEDEFEYFNYFESGASRWKELIIYVVNKQKIKYKNN